MSKTTFTILGVLILIAGFIVYHYVHTSGDLPFDMTVVKRGTLIQEVSASGSVNAIVTVQVRSQVSGAIKEIYVDYNNPVKKGQILAFIDPDAFLAQLSQAQANLNTAKANHARQETSLLYSKALLEKADVQLKEVGLNLKRAGELFNKGLVSRSQLDEAEASYDTAHAQKKAQEAQYQSELRALNASKAQIAQWEGAVNLAKVNLEYTKIKSPIDGIVLSRNIEVGQTISSSPQTEILFVVAKDLAKMEVNTNVSEADIGNIKKGQEVAFKVDAYPDKVFSGRVKEIRMAPNIEQKIVTYGVITGVDNEELLLRPGMTADVWIRTASREDVLLIPAITVKEEDGKRYVEVMEGRGIKKRDVKTGLKGTDGLIEILSGLNEGEKVVLSIRRK